MSSPRDVQIYDKLCAILGDVNASSFVRTRSAFKGKCAGLSESQMGELEKMGAVVERDEDDCDKRNIKIPLTRRDYAFRAFVFGVDITLVLLVCATLFVLLSYVKL